MSHRLAAAVARLDDRDRGHVAYWYRVGAGDVRLIFAPDEPAARAAVLARHPGAAGERIGLVPWQP
jgi:hypothetical protein